jgi:hypothetical protein
MRLVDGLTALAKLLGATRDSPGGIGPYTVANMNGDISGSVSSWHLLTMSSWLGPYP